MCDLQNYKLITVCLLYVPQFFNCLQFHVYNNNFITESKMGAEKNQFESFTASFVVILSISVLGNIFNLLSISYAHVKKRHNFHGTNWSTSSVFQLNLSVTNLCYCLLSFIAFVYAILIYFNEEQGGTHDVGDETVACQIFVLGYQTLALTNGWSVALISISRACSKTF